MTKHTRLAPATRGGSDKVSERRQHALDLRITGMGFRAIGRELGISRQTAFRDVESALDEIRKLTREKAQHLLDLELQRCDKLTRAMWPLAEQGDEKSARAILAVMDRRAKLLGLDQAIKIDATVAQSLESLSADELEQRAAALVIAARKLQRFDAEADE